MSEPDKSRTSTRLPRIDVQQLWIGTLALGAELAGKPASLAVQGSAHLISLEDASAAIVARRTDGTGDYELRLRFDPSRMDATLKLAEPAGGPLANLLQHPGLGELSVEVNLTGRAPRSTCSSRRERATCVLKPRAASISRESLRI